MPIRVDSEVGRLRRVLVHRPGREIDWMVPSMMEQLLFDDILHGEDAREEHDTFCEVLRHAGIEVLDAQDLLEQVLHDPEVRDGLLGELEREYEVAPRQIQWLAGLTARDLASAVIEGIRTSPTESAAGHAPFFQVNPLPNYFFQRDPQTVIGDRVMISSMPTDAREREPLVARTFIRHHPAFAGTAAIFDVDVPLRYTSLEGGDVLVASPEVVLVGLSERTNRRGAEALAEHLRREETSFRHLVLVELPRKRSYMHLDTVFTFIDRNTCLAHIPVIEPGRPESAHISVADLSAPEPTFTLRSSLLRVLADLGMELEVVPCGGREVIDQEREQWTDGANSFALAPGVILLYRRNRRTLEELDRRGWRVLTAEEALKTSDLLDGGPTVISLFDNELSRARGGPHCMTMPLERDSI